MENFNHLSLVKETFYWLKKVSSQKLNTQLSLKWSFCWNMMTPPSGFLFFCLIQVTPPTVEISAPCKQKRHLDLKHKTTNKRANVNNWLKQRDGTTLFWRWSRPTRRWFWPTQRWSRPTQRWSRPTQRRSRQTQRWSFPTQRWSHGGAGQPPYPLQAFCNSSILLRLETHFSRK